MKFEFVKEKELELINNRFAEENSIDYDNWDLMSDEEILIKSTSHPEDMMSYVEFLSEQGIELED
jgi:hypothetical protein